MSRSLWDRAAGRAGVAPGQARDRSWARPARARAQSDSRLAVAAKGRCRHRDCGPNLPPSDPRSSGPGPARRGPSGAASTPRPRQGWLPAGSTGTQNSEFLMPNAVM